MGQSTQMTAYECLSLTVGVLTLLVLSWTLIVLMRYARDTKKLAWAAAEQLPRPCVVLKRSADTSDDAVLRDTAVSLAGQNYLCFANVGTGPACQRSVKLGPFEIDHKSAA